jgi:hypothetical protein
MWVYQFAPWLRVLDVLGSAAAIALNVKLLRAAWRVFQGNAEARPVVRMTAALLLVLVGAWFLLALIIASASTSGMGGQYRSMVLAGMTGTAIMALLLTGVVYTLFREPVGVQTTK